MKLLQMATVVFLNARNVLKYSFDQKHKFVILYAISSVYHYYRYSNHK